MSLTKKDPSLRVAASDPHLVSLGGGRLSTAVTIHYIHIGDTTIGSAVSCSISLNGSGVRPLHCTIYRSDANEVTLVPEQDARLLIDGAPILEETKLSQGAMITIGNSNYLRFNNPDEAQMMRSAMGSNERISMPQIDFTQSARQAHDLSQSLELESFYESIINPINHNNNNHHNPSAYELDCPKVFSADLVTVNMPAKDVLGQKYASFARNLAENHRNEKQLNNQFAKGVGSNSGYWNVPSNAAIYKEQQQQQHQQAQQQAPTDHLLTKVNNDRYDRYPKTGGLQIYSMNGVNNEINNGLMPGSVGGGGSSSGGGAELEDMLKICTEYADRNNSMNHGHNNTSSTSSSITSSPIVQNRIKTNGSLPRDKNKSPFPTQQQTGSGGSTAMLSSSSGYENVRLLGPNRVEINGQIHVPASAGNAGGGGSGGGSGAIPTAAVRASHENLVNPVGVGKYVPQSPRTKIRTNCMSPKKEISFGNAFALAISPPPAQAQPQAQVSSAPVAIPICNMVKPPLAPKPPAPNLQRDYEQLFKSFDRKQKQLDRLVSPKPRSNKNINNLTLNLQAVESQTQSSPKPSRKPAPAPRSIHLEQRQRRELIQRRKQVKRELAELPPSSGVDNLELEMDEQPLAATASPRLQLQALQHRVRRLEAQRNATRVMEENQQAKLKQSIEMKQDQLKKLRAMLKQKPNNACLKEELQLVCESLESDRKTFEDLEFQYFEEESEHHASHEEFKRHEQRLTLEAELAALRIQIGAGEDEEEEQEPEHDTPPPSPETSSSSNLINGGVMSQSLFGSAELLCPKLRNHEDLMSKSVNENMFYNHKIEATGITSTPKRVPLQLFENIGGSCEQISFNLSLQSDRFEVNPLERRVPSQDDIDRSCKVANDAPISTSQGASTKIFDSIKEIERNRKLLLAQQGHQVIEHERQKMYDLKKKSHDEARTQYLLSTQQQHQQLPESDANGGKDAHLFEKAAEMQKLSSKADDDTPEQQQQVQKLNGDKENRKSTGSSPTTTAAAAALSATPQQQRHSQPELEHHAIALGLGSGTGGGGQLVARSPRPLSEANNCEAGLEAPKFANGMMDSTISSAQAGTDNKRASSNSQDTASAGSGSGNSGSGGSTASERKRVLPKHQRPLTRYLPIFSPDLNLRHHIETAGHQIDLCPHVFVDAQSCRGYLHKLGATFHAWSRRWFVLDRQRGALIYFSDKSERKTRGGAYFASIDEVYLDHLNASKSGRPHCTFIVKTKKRSYNLQAASDSAARIWIDAIITGAQGNLDY
ncbi:pleckstrin homology-like domain family B member 1 isoform X2 [Drosophila kikkawai]|uniref:Pleckstrin homology-like domain family B member 1 isoform X2 n=1 Tax=Drosophila kikkawai TaxID=30033 RepID=A0A6P4INK1_DROKI|nr:pleckstrin homology-like domain family B member 1 isoform X2 [Drosophila kikkawai]